MLFHERGQREIVDLSVDITGLVNRSGHVKVSYMSRYETRMSITYSRNCFCSGCSSCQLLRGGHTDTWVFSSQCKAVKTSRTA